MAARFADKLAGDSRVHQRTHLCLAAFLDCDGLKSSVRIRDLSRDGARIEASPAPPVNRPVVLTRGVLTVTGQTVWRDRDRSGLRFDRPIDLDTWLPVRETVRTQEDVDRAIAVIRRSMTPVTTAESDKRVTASNLHERLADELNHAVRMIESLRDSVAGEPQMIAKHSTKLPYFDQSLTLLRQVAEVIAEPDRKKAIGRIADVDFRRRLTRSSI
jgi:hypothetical protein